MELAFSFAAGFGRPLPSSKLGSRPLRSPAVVCSASGDGGVTTSRRQFGLGALVAGLAGISAASASAPTGVVEAAFLVPTSPYKLPADADRTKMKTFLPQLDDGYAVVLDLERTWDQKTASLDGDIVRRIVGTVGVKSPLFNIGKAINGALSVALNDPSVTDETIDLLQESAGEIIDGISAIDFQLYSVNFTELEPTKITLLDQAKEAVDGLVVSYRTFLEYLPNE